jgi:predicted transcriptional regulator
MARKTTTGEETEAEAAVFKALSDPTRLRLVKYLCHQHCGSGVLCVNALADMLGISQSAVSQHLRILKGIGLVRGQRHGCCIHYGIDHQALRHCHEVFHAVLAGEDASEDSR